METVLRYGLTPVMYNMERAQSLSRLAMAAGKSVQVHVKVDTGMGRVGVPLEQALEFVRQVKGLRGLVLEGICTHFATAEEEDFSFTRWQAAAFETLYRELTLSGIHIPLRHAANCRCRPESILRPRSSAPG